MSFIENINRSGNNMSKNFNIDDFNSNFTIENGSTQMSEVLTFELPDNNIVAEHGLPYNGNKLNRVQEFQLKQFKIDTKLLDKRFMNPEGNYTNPYMENFIDPNQDSETRHVFLVIVDKYTRKYLSIKRNPYNYDMTGGRTKIVESFENAAIRNLKLETGLDVDKNHLIKLLDATGNNIQAITYIAFIFKGKPTPQPGTQTEWVPLNKLNENTDPHWKKYNMIVYERILQNLY